MAQGGGSPAHHDPVGFGGQFGYYTDTETGLLCLTHRYYDPGTGKFLNRDPIGYAGGQNLYGFADGNPVNESDPNGTDGYDNFSNFCAGAGDVISGGLTQKFRAHFGYDDVVDKQSGTYHGGQIAGVGYVAVSTVVDGVGVVNGVRAFRAAGGVRALAGSIRNVNIGFPGAGRTLNCVRCAEVTAHTLAGHPACALPGGVTPIAQLEVKFGGRFLPIGSSAAIADKLVSAGSGSQGIVFGIYKGQRNYGRLQRCQPEWSNTFP